MRGARQMSRNSLDGKGDSFRNQRKRCTRHYRHLGAQRILNDRVATVIGDAAQSARSIGIRAGQHHSDGAFPVTLGGGAEGHVYRWPAVTHGSVVVQRQEPSSDSEVVIGWRNIDVSVAQRLIVLRLKHEQRGFILE